MLDVIKEILLSEKEFTEAKYKRLQKALVYTKINLILMVVCIYQLTL